MNEQAILFLMEVLNGFEEPPRSDWPARGGGSQLFPLGGGGAAATGLGPSRGTLASETVDGFAAKLGLYAETCVTDQQHRIFRIAAETP